MGIAFFNLVMITFSIVGIINQAMEVKDLLEENEDMPYAVLFSSLAGVIPYGYLIYLILK